MAYPMRCVNETFFPLAASWLFSALRRASGVVAEMSRKEVAVGTVSDSVMLATSRAAGPVIAVAPLGRRERGEVRSGETDGSGVPDRTSSFSLLPGPSDRSVGITG